ncbi:MAG: hypothetical protein ABSB15_07975 [Bryobacteraceae bacterium]|jgi:superfamily II DNA/RNA helicase
MNVSIEERLEKLTERHEALTQTVEIIAVMRKENEKRFAERAAENDRRFAETDRRTGQVLEGITQLGHIAESHDHRLDNLEGNSR